MAKHYEKLDPGEVRTTIDALSRRIHDRFPGSGLHGVSRRLAELGAVAGPRAAQLSRPFWGLRIAAALLVLAGLAGGAAALSSLHVASGPVPWHELVQALDAGINEIVLISAAIFFLFTLGIRIRRRRVLRALYELRSVAHIIDMHQLTKDPERLHVVYVPTPSSPVPQLGALELERYLDYCSELLSLTGKVAAVYVEAIDDPPLLAAAGEIEALCAGLSGKIWQKIDVIQTLSSISSKDSSGRSRAP